MTTFDLAEVRTFTASLETRMVRCDNGEGMECANLEGSLQHYASLCSEYQIQVRDWCKAVFSGAVPFDAQTNLLWQNAGNSLFQKAEKVFTAAEAGEAPCYTLDGLKGLGFQLWVLQRLLSPWLPPARAVSPAARRGARATPEQVEAARKRLAGLPPLPANWRPTGLPMNPTARN